MHSGSKDIDYMSTWKAIVNDRELLIVFIASIFFSVIYSIFSILKFLALDASGWDLGIHAQVLWTTLHGSFFYSNLIGQSLLAEHFAPFEFLQVPLYALFPSPISLLIFQAIFVSFAAVPLFLIARKVLSRYYGGHRISHLFPFLIILSYYLSPLTLSMISFDFHNISFLPFFIFLAIYAFLNEKGGMSIFSFVMIISLHSNFVFMVGVVLLYEFFYLRTNEGKNIHSWLSSHGDARSKRNSMFFLIAVILLYSYLLVASSLKGMINGTPSVSIVASTGATGTPFTSVPGLIHIVFTNPMLILQAIYVNIGVKGIFLLILFGSLIFLPLASPLTLILSIPFMVYALPSSYTSYYELGEQYTGMIVAAAYISAVFGYSNILRIYEMRQKTHHHKPLFRKLTKSGPWVASGAIIIATILVVPLGAFSPPQVFERPGGSQMVDLFELQYNNNGSSFLIHAQSQIPSDSYILTQNNLMPFFSNYANAYSTPWSPGITSNMHNFQFIVIQNGSFWAEQPSTAGSLQSIATTSLANGTFTIFESDPSLNLYILARTN